MRLDPLVVGVVLLVAVVRLPSFTRQLFDPDEAAIAAQAISLRHGGTLYVDAIDRKPPLPPYLYSWMFHLTGNTDLRPIHVLAAFALVGAALVVACDARRRWGIAAGWWAAGLMVVGAVGFLPVNAQAANYAHFALFPGAVAVVACRRGTSPAALVGGVALGLAVLCRQTWAIGVIPGAVAVVLTGRRRDLALFAGALAATVAVVGLAMPFGAFWHWTFSSNGSFVLSGPALGPTLTSLQRNGSIFVEFHVLLVCLLVAAGWLRSRHRPQWRVDVDLWLWLATACVAVTTGLRFFGHYWIQLIPPAVMLAAPVAARMQGRLRAVALAALVVPAVIAFALAFTPSSLRTLDNPQPFATYADSHSAPADPILVWGNFPEIYWAADRPPGGALVTSNFVTGLSGNRTPGPATLADATPGALVAFMSALRADPPTLVFDTSTADLNGYGDYPLATFPALASFVAGRYERATSIEGVTVYRLR